MNRWAWSATLAARAGAQRQPAVGAWLLAIAALVIAMILVGGATRLTDSGLSITEWNLEKGLVPPLSAQRWAEEFSLYQRTTEYRQQNFGMSLAEFRYIYWWEWSHRFLGKMLGLVFALPFIVFAVSGRLKRRFWPVLGLFALGGAQGAIGWWMVTSGLWSGLDVSPLRLAVHLGMAFLLLAGALWLGLGALEWPRQAHRRGVAPWSLILLLAMLFTQILMGAILAGADGGKAYADWPTIGGQWWPSGAFEGALTQNHATQQLIHRTLGYMVGLTALLVAWRGAQAGGSLRWACLALGALALGQIGLGVATIMHAAPLGLSLAHQAGAIALWVSAICAFRVVVK